MVRAAIAAVGEPTADVVIPLATLRATSACVVGDSRGAASVGGGALSVAFVD